MNRKQRRYLRRHRRSANREHYVRNRRHWLAHGPPVVLDHPTEAHAKALLIDWVLPRVILDEVQKEVATHYAQITESVFFDALSEASHKKGSALEPWEIWCHVVSGVSGSVSPASLSVSSVSLA